MDESLTNDGSVFMALQDMLDRVQFDPLPPDTAYSWWEREYLFHVEKIQVADCAPEALILQLQREGWKRTGPVMEHERWDEKPGK